jgi:hypothetical protein
MRTAGILGLQGRQCFEAIKLGEEALKKESDLRQLLQKDALKLSFSTLPLDTFESHDFYIAQFFINFHLNMLPMDLNFIILDYLLHGQDIGLSLPLTSEFGLSRAIIEGDVEAIKEITRVSYPLSNMLGDNSIKKLSGHEEKWIYDNLKLYEKCKNKKKQDDESYLKGYLYLTNPHIVARYTPTLECSLDNYLLNGEKIALLFTQILDYSYSHLEKLIQNNFPLDFLVIPKNTKSSQFIYNLLEHLLECGKDWKKNESPDINLKNLPFIHTYTSNKHLDLYNLFIKHIDPNVTLDYLLKNSTHLPYSNDCRYICSVAKDTNLSPENVIRVNDFFHGMDGYFHNLVYENLYKLSFEMKHWYIVRQLDYLLLHGKEFLNPSNNMPPLLLRFAESYSISFRKKKEILTLLLSSGVVDLNQFYQCKTVFHHIVESICQTFYDYEHIRRRELELKKMEELEGLCYVYFERGYITGFNINQDKLIEMRKNFNQEDPVSYPMKDDDSMNNNYCNSSCLITLLLEKKANMHLGWTKESNALTSIASKNNFQSPKDHYFHTLLWHDDMNSAYENFCQGGGSVGRITKRLQFHYYTSFKERKDIGIGDVKQYLNSPGYRRNDTRIKQATRKLFDGILQGDFSEVPKVSEEKKPTHTIHKRHG